jgi:Xaa-Pro dipeptidase
MRPLLALSLAITLLTPLAAREVPPMPRLLTVREQYDLRLQWLAERHARLLPMMRAHGLGMWIVVNEEFHDDPLMWLVAPPLTYVSRRDVLVFIDGGPAGLLRYSNYWRPTADYARFFTPLPVPRSERGIQDTGEGLKLVFDKYQPKTIGLAFGGQRGHDSSLTHDTYRFLAQAMGPEAERRFVPAAAFIEEYADTRLPDELEHYRALVQATDHLAQRSLSNAVITPGRTTAADLKWWWNDQIARLGVGATPWFEIHTAVQRFDPNAGKAIPYVHPAPDDYVFQRGDVVHLDTGFNYLGFASDWQKVAYILRDGETDVPAGLQRALANANRTQEAMAKASRPGMTGWEAARATLGLLKGVDFTPSLYSHAIGHHGHALGPDINARNGVLGDRPARESRLRLGSYRSIELSATTAVPEWNGATVTIPMEDDAYLTDDGYAFFRPIQRDWYLIR